MPGVSVSSSLRHDCPPFLWSIEMSEPTNMANMFWNLDKISETTAIHSGFRLCPIISHSSMRRTIPVAFISKTPFILQIAGLISLAKDSIRRIFPPMRQEKWFHFPKKPAARRQPVEKTHHLRKFLRSHRVTQMEQEISPVTFMQVRPMSNRRSTATMRPI